MRRPSWTRAALVSVWLCGTFAGAGYAQPFANTGTAPDRSTEPRGVVELFTSQGCSSCPPADQTVGALAADRTLIALSVPIDYWDYLGWKDTLARPRHTARQRGYAARRGDREVYTPQAVINGVVQVLGSDRKAIEDGIIISHSRPGTMTLPMKLAFEGDVLRVTVTPKDESGNEGEVWLCTLSRSVPVEIKRGENRNRTITYHNVVRRWIKLGQWGGPGQSWTIARKEFDGEGIDSIVVLVQAGSADTPGPIFGAAEMSLR